ncbi:MAG: hypothetical protein AAB392_02535 [Patescibacteria group bacterium]
MLKTHWLLPVLLYIVIAHLGIGWAKKYIVGLHSRTQRFFLQYLFCAVMAIIFAIALGQFSLSPYIVGIGLLNGLACYCMWKATDISLAKTSLFTFIDDILAMSLSYMILAEGEILNSWNSTGIGLCVLSVVLFALYAYQRRESLAFFVYTAVYSVLWGVTIFSVRYAAFNKLPPGQFLSGWYLGSLVAAILIVLFYKDNDESQRENETKTLRIADVAGMFVYAFGIALCLGTLF